MLDYETSSQVFESSGGADTVSELHGLICGMACLSDDPGKAKVDLKKLAQDYLDQESEVDPELGELIDRIYDELVAGLESRSMTFQLLLPPDDTPIVDRTENLAAWCRGYLMGMVAAGLEELSQLPGDGNEIAKDLLQISEAVADEGESEDQEKDYFEIQEYVRVGVQSIYDETHQQQPSEQA